MRNAEDTDDWVDGAASHALGWLVFGNSVGLLLSILLLEPDWQPAALTYGRWVPLHLNAQLYGWTALPLVGWLLHIYEVDASKAGRWSTAAVWGWTAALAIACFQWLGGETSGKIFLDWRNSSLWAFVSALVFLWIVLAVAWRDRSPEWTKGRRILSLAGICGLAMVPVLMVVSSSPKTYPPIDPTTGGPTGSSLLGSALVVVGLMLMLPRVAGTNGAGKAGTATWVYFGFSWIAFAVTEAVGGHHFDPWQIGAMLLLVPWAWLIPWDWSGFKWPENSGSWRMAMISWWALLVVSGVGMYQPGALDHIKFTQALVAHSHLAMAGFTTSFCALLLSLLTRRPIGNRISVGVWNLAALLMILVLALMGWREGNSTEWMIVHATWREVGLIARSLCGALMLGASVSWLTQFRNK